MEVDDVSTELVEIGVDAGVSETVEITPTGVVPLWNFPATCEEHAYE